MTWAEWCDSEYNTRGAYVDGSYIEWSTYGNLDYVAITVDEDNMSTVSASDTITANFAYVVKPC